MPQASRLFLTSSACIVLASCAFSVAIRGAEPPAATLRSTAQMETFAAEGQAYFALELSPQVAEPPREPHDVAILFDTSASQTGSFRDKGLAALERLLASLDASDRAALLAVDLNAIALTPALVNTDSDEMKRALGALRGRVPLGSTDMDGALASAAEQLMRDTRPGRARSVVYIGDGMSTAQLLFSERLQQLANQFVVDRISISSYSVGPRVDHQLLGVLAKHTGGMLLVDRTDQTGAQIGGRLADAARSTVVWPTSVELPAGFQQCYFRGIPPLRFDRDTVLLGKADLALVQKGKTVQVKIEAEAADKPLSLDWRIEPGKPVEENAYLRKLVETAERDGDLSLPTIGTAELGDLRWFVNVEAGKLAQLGQQALASGQLDQAQRLAREAARLDPLNPQAEILKVAVDKKAGPAVGAREPRALVLASSDQPARPLNPPPAETGQAAEEGADGELLDELERQQHVYVQFLRSEVQNAVRDAARLTGVDPENALNLLKLTLEKVNQAPELDPEVRSQLRDKLEGAMQIASRQALVKAERDLQRQQIDAEVKAREQINRELFLTEEKVDQLIARFNALMDEERYRDAEAVANIAEEMSPNTPGLRSAELTARMIGYTADMQAVVDARNKGVIDSMYQIELSHVPTPDEPPILYPDPEVWQLLTERRKKYKAVDLTQNNPNEARILAALDDKTEIDFTEQPLIDVIDYLKERHGIEIQLDTKALTDAGLGSDTPVTRNIKGITLRSALRLMLGEMDLTYVIRNEVLMITSKTEAENLLTTKVYPVADLVIPIPAPRMGGMGGGMMGGMGGGMGGGMMGGMGGGMGMGGMGMGF